MKYKEEISYSLCFSPAFLVYQKDFFKKKLQKNKFNNEEFGRFYFYCGGQDFERRFEDLTFYTFKYLRRKGFKDDQARLVYDSRMKHHESAWSKYFPICLVKIFSRCFILLVRRMTFINLAQSLEGITPTRNFNLLYIILDSIFLVVLLGLLIYQKKYVTLIWSLIGGVLYYIVDYGYFYLISASRVVTVGGVSFLPYKCIKSSYSRWSK